MSLTIRLYQSCKLSNKYDEVFRTQSSLETYLATLTHYDVYSGDDIYYTNNGSISIDNNGLLVKGDKYNYIAFIKSGEPNRYGFIDTITIVDEVCVISYTEDIWHTYAIKTNEYNFNVKNSIIAQAKTLTANTEYDATAIGKLPYKLPIDYEGHNKPEFVINSALPLESSCFVCVTASMYKLGTAGQVNERFISNYLLKHKPNATGGYTPSSSGSIYWNIDNQTISDIATLVAISSDTQVRNKVIDDPNWYYEIIEVKLIPFKMGSAFFNNYLTAGTDSDAGLFTDFVVPINKVDLATDGTYQMFNTDIEFLQLMMTDYTLYKDSQGNNRHTYNGIRPSDLVKYNDTIGTGFKVIAYGNMSRTLPHTPDGQSHSVTYYFNADVSNCRIEMFYDNTFYDITGDFTIDIPIDAQSASITQQQKIAIKVSNLTSMISMVEGAVQTGLSMASEYVSGIHGIASSKHTWDVQYAGDSAGLRMGSTALSGISSLLQSAIKLDAQNTHQYVTNKAVNTNEVVLYNTLLGGLRTILCSPVNEELVNNIVSKYGYLYRIFINDISIIDNSDYVRFSQINLYGDFSQNIARNIETILENGVILSS